MKAKSHVKTNDYQRNRKRTLKPSTVPSCYLQAIDTSMLKECVPAKQSAQNLGLRRLLVGVTGSIAASLIPNALLWLRQNGGIRSIDIVLSATASTMVSRRALSALTSGTVFVDAEVWPNASEPLHITLTRDADLFLVMPATANVLGKAANGIADDLITTCLIAAPCPVVFAPCMNKLMWSKPSVRRNVATLRRDGCHVIEPTEGFCISTGSTEFGAFPSMPSIFSQLLSQIQRHGSLDKGNVARNPQ